MCVCVCVRRDIVCKDVSVFGVVGLNVSAVGGSDDHDGGEDSRSYNRIGHPTTVVYAEVLTNI